MRFPLITGILFYLLLCSCQDEIDRRLDDIEKFIIYEPDSALYELGIYFDSTKMNPGQIARHKLLTAQSMEAAWMDSLLATKSDSLLDYPLKYFTENGDNRRLSISLFLKGTYEFSSEFYPQALSSLLQSAELADHDTLPYWSMRIHELIADTYKKGYQDDKSIVHYRLAKNYSRLTHSTIHELCNWIDVAIAYSNDNNYKLAILTADSVIKEYASFEKKDPVWWKNINFLLLPVYADAKENDKALKAFSYIRNKPNPLGYAYFLGVCQMHANIGDNNTANIYLDSAFMISRTHRDTMVCKGYLAERYRREGRDEEAIQLEYLVKKWSDSIASATLNQSLAQVEADFNRGKWLRQQEKNRRLKIMGGTAAALILIAGVVGMLLIRHRQRKNQNRLIALESELRNTFNALQIREEELKTLVKDKDEASGKRINELLNERQTFIQHVADYWIKYGGNDNNGKGMDIKDIMDRLRAPETMRPYLESADRERQKWPALNDKEVLLKTMLDSGLTVKVIAMLLDEPCKTIYTRRKRMEEKLKAENKQDKGDDN